MPEKPDKIFAHIIQPLAFEVVVIQPLEDETDNNKLNEIEFKKFLTDENTNNMPSSKYQVNGRLDESISVGGEDQMGESHTSDVGGTTRVVMQHQEMKVPSKFLRSIFGSAKDDICTFMSKPTIIQSGVFATTDNPATFPLIDCYAGLDDVIRKDKLKGILSIRADTVLTLECSATPFMSGIYILAAIQKAGAFRTTNVAHKINAHRFSAVQVTQLPRVDFNLSNDKTVQLHVPFVSSYSSFNISITNNNAFKVGSPAEFFLYPYLNLEVVTGPTSVPFNVWVHYTNVEIYGNSIPQGARTRGKTVKGRDLIQDEVQSGPFSKTFSLVADVTESLSNVPLLSSVMGPVSWVARATANMASAFGWSKPIVLSDVVRTHSSLTPYLANADSKSYATPLTLSSDNHLEQIPFGGTDLDELSIDYIKSIPSWFDGVAWPYTFAAGR